MQEQFGVFVNQVLSKSVARNQVKVAFLKQVVFDTAEYVDVVTLAEFRDDHADCKAALSAQTAREEIGTVLKLSRGRENHLSGLRRNCVGDRCTVHYKRDSCGSKSEVVCQLFQPERLHWSPSTIASILLGLAAGHLKSLAQ